MSSGGQLKSADSVATLTVLGAGTMGAGIAHVAALAGISVTLRDIDEAVLERALSTIRANLDKGVARGKVEAADRDAALGRIATDTDLEASVAAADVVIEAVPEAIELKREIFGTLAKAAPAHALLATNTSSLSIAEIAAAGDPARVVGMHFFNPVHIMKLVEVVSHDGAALDTTRAATQLAERFGKTPITVKDAPGFASSRLGLVIGLEAIRMVEQGVASASDIDTAMKLGYGHPMGPLELTDLVGLDVRHKIASYLATEIGEHFKPPELLSTMVADGKLGKKTGQGFYRWVDGKKQ
ncbi:MAG: 3-hydroxyacyl-CoA dehydrogenase family protein [Deltaproteobacteria bacterium]|nr:3-hydroxyacyl-CoA dehydrogenase family protein [Deltaproteobacteria bacterium]